MGNIVPVLEKSTTVGVKCLRKSGILSSYSRLMKGEELKLLEEPKTEVVDIGEDKDADGVAHGCIKVSNIQITVRNTYGR